MPIETYDPIINFINEFEDIFTHPEPIHMAGTEKITLLSRSAIETYAGESVPSFYHVVYWISLIIGVAPLILILAEIRSYLLGIHPIVYLYLSAASFSIFITNKIAKKEWEERYVESEYEKFRS